MLGHLDEFKANPWINQLNILVVEYFIRGFARRASLEEIYQAVASELESR